MHAPQDLARPNLQRLIDIGVNLTNASFKDDCEAVVSQAVEAGVSHIIVTGTDLEESRSALALARQFPEQLYSTAGVHPHDAKTYTANTDSELSALAKEAKVVAVGETGLDFNRMYSPEIEQIKAFEAQLEIASDVQLPLFLHERDAFVKQHDILHHYRDALAGGVLHCFTGDKEALYAYLDLDLYIGITGWVCDERRGVELQKLVKDIPLERLLIETDAPYLLPRDLKPKPKSRRNLPSYLPHIAQTIAGLRGCSPDVLAQATRENTLRLFTKINT